METKIFAALELANAVELLHAAMTKIYHAEEMQQNAPTDAVVINANEAMDCTEHILTEIGKVIGKDTVEQIYFNV